MPRTDRPAPSATPGRKRRKRRSGGILLARLALFLLLFFGNSYALIADSDSLLRAQVGLKLFRAMMLADQGAADKTDADGVLHVLLVYADDLNQAQDLAATLKRDITPIHNLPVQVDVVPLTLFNRNAGSRLLAVFIAQRLHDDELQQLISLSIRHRILLFSPFEGDVEQGVLGGLSVQASVRPFINMRTLKRSGVQIKPFYLKVARQYE